MTRKPGKKCPYGGKACRQIMFYECGKGFYCCGYVINNRHVKIDKVRLCLAKEKKNRILLTFTPDEAIMISDALSCGVLFFLTHNRNYKKWRGWQ